MAKRGGSAHVATIRTKGKGGVVYTSHLLRRSYREGGKVRHENLGNLSHLPVEIIEAVRAEDNYAMIFDVGSQTSVIVAADKNLDITDKVMARLKAAPRPAAAPKTGTTPSTLQPKPAGVSRPPGK